jgi:hypothetical protein
VGWGSVGSGPGTCIRRRHSGSGGVVSARPGVGGQGVDGKKMGSGGAGKQGGKNRLSSGTQG